MTYTYDATGNKLTKVSTTTGITTRYVNGIQYNGSAIDFIQTEEGKAVRDPANGNYQYEYNLTDHLGNIRKSFDIYAGAARVIQEDDYYAFGKRKVIDTGANKYLYNGKELQEELQQYDYGARFYDPVTGRWNSVDPNSEGYENWSPYNYVLNNPIFYTDPDGKDPDGSIARAMERDNVRYLEGKISKKELVANREARAAGGLFGLSLILPGPEDLLIGEFLATRVGTKLVGAFEKLFSKADEAVDVVKTAEKAADISKAEISLGRSERTFTKKINEHKQKVKDYLKDPEKFDNMGKLKGKTGKEREQIINGRVQELESQIKKQEGELKKVQTQLKKLRDEQ